MLLVINGELGQFALNLVIIGSALLVLSLPYLTSIIDICVLRALHRRARA
jgi:hypothetical protein